MDEYNLIKYLHATDIIKHLETAMSRLSVIGSGINLTTHVEYDANGAHVVSPKIQQLIEDESRQYEMLADRRNRWKIRQRLFIAYLASLSVADRLAILNYPDCSERLKEQTQAELFEIETYTAFHCGFEPPEEHVELPTNPVDSVTAMKDFLEGA